MAGLLAVDALAEYRRVDPHVHPAVWITCPDQVRRYSMRGTPLGSLTYGYHEPLIESFDDIPFMLPDHLGGLQGVRTSIVITDFDRTWQGLTNSRYRRSLEGSAVEIRDTSIRIAAANFPLIFKGILIEIEQLSTFRWRLHFGSNDSAITQSNFQLPMIDQYSFPSIVSTDTNRFQNVILGRFDSNDGTVAGSSGSLRAIRMNLSDGTGGFAYRYLASSNWITRVLRVQVNGTVQGVSTWVRTYNAIMGLAVTEIRFASDPGASATVTFDAWGIGEDVAANAGYYNYVSGTGEPITNPTKQMKWLLCNGVFNAYRPTAPRTIAPAKGYADAPLDQASWDASIAYDEQRRYRGVISPVTDTTASPSALFADWCRAWHKRPYWTPDNKIALALCDWEEPTPFYEAPRWLRWTRQGEEDNFAPKRPAKSARIDRIRSASWVVPAAGASRTPTTVGSGLSSGPVTETFDNRFAEAMRAFEPTVLPASITRAWFADMVTALGNNPIRNGSDVLQLYDCHFGGTAALDTAGINPPLFRCGAVTTGPAGRPYLEFSTFNRWMYGSATDTLANLITAAEHTFIVVFRVRAATLNDPIPANNHILISDDNAGKTGIHVRASGGAYYVYAQGFDGASRATPDIAINLNQWYIVRARHENGYLSCTVDNWNLQTIACGDISDLTGKITIGGVSDARGSVYGDVDIAAVIVGNSATALMSQGATAYNAAPALHDNYMLWRALQDRYGL